MFATARRAFMMSGTTFCAPFSRAVVRAMQKLYPKALADNSWDNTGLLLEAPFNPSNPQSNHILLTIDLTRAVADEAIALKSSIIIAYHPVIFRGLKSLTLANTQQQTLLRLAQHGISVYSPHTAVDAAPGGLGDWLADIVTRGTETEAESAENTTESTPKSEEDRPNPLRRPTYTLAHHPSHHDVPRATASPSPPPTTTIPHNREAIIPQSPPLESHPGAGMGRIVTFSSPQPLPAILDRIGRGLNNPKCFPIAIPQGLTISDLEIESVGICAGSGASMLADADVDMWFTGEVGHHEALAAIERGVVVVQLFHSNSERGFLEEVLRGQVEGAVGECWEVVRGEMDGDEDEEGFVVEVSRADRDPFGIVVLKE